MRKIFISTFVGIISISVCASSINRKAAAETLTNQEAKLLWEKAIAAKGGRERLLSVKNIVSSSRGEYTTHRGRKNLISTEELFVLPDKVWRWQDMRPDVFGLRVEMYNYEAKIAYVLTPDVPNEPIRHLTDQYTWEELGGLLNAQVIGFMETRWVKPVPVAVRQDKVNGRIVNIVQTQVLGKRFDFALDPQNHLPFRISSYDKLITGGEGFTIFNVDLLDYVEVNGIKVPQKLKPENGPTYSRKIQINVNYNESVFAKPTNIESGSEAWKAK
jgi:hypothetical protein